MRVTAGWRKLAMVWCLVAQPLFAQAGPGKVKPTGAIDGIVTDTSLVALADATVSLVGSDVQVITGANGRFRILKVPVGQHVVVAKRLGYEPMSSVVRVLDSDTLRLAFTLERLASTLDTVVVAAKRQSPRMAEFDERRQHAIGGQFLTQADIERRNSVFATELIRTFMSVKIVGGRAASLREGAGRTCVLDVLVDGLRFSDTLDNLPSPRLIAGIELYAGPASIPVQYKRSGAGSCGLIMVWTRDGFQPPL